MVILLILHYLEILLVDNFDNVNGDLVIGSSPWDSDYYRGMLDDIRIYEGALSDEEIKSLYSKELVGEENLSSNAIVVLPGNISASNYVFALDDNVFNEPFETLALSIDSIENGVSGSILSGDIVIVDNDITPKASISNVGSSNTIREGTQSYVTIQASLDQVTTRDVTVVLENSGDASDLDFSLSTNNDTTGTVATLAAHYKFDGDTNDETDNDNDGVNNGAVFVEDRFGNPNKALYFNMENSNVTVPFTGSLRIRKRYYA